MHSLLYISLAVLVAALVLSLLPRSTLHRDITGADLYRAGLLSRRMQKKSGPNRRVVRGPCSCPGPYDEPHFDDCPESLH